MLSASIQSEAATREVFCEKGVLKDFTIFTGKHLRWSLLLIKVQARREPNTGASL